MLEAEQALLDIYPPSWARIVLQQASHEPHEHMAIFFLHLAVFGGQQMLQRPEAVSNPVSVMPGGESHAAL
jgi:hypothetical protein